MTVTLVNQSTTSCPQRRSRHPQTCSSTRFQIRRSPSPGTVHPVRWPVTGLPSPLFVLTALRQGPCRCPSHPMHMLILPTCSRAHCTASTSTPSMVEWRASRLWEKRLPVSNTMDKGARIRHRGITTKYKTSEIFCRLTYLIFSNPSRTWFSLLCAFHWHRPWQCIGYVGGSPRHRQWLPSLPEHRGLQPHREEDSRQGHPVPFEEFTSRHPVHSRPPLWAGQWAQRGRHHIFYHWSVLRQTQQQRLNFCDDFNIRQLGSAPAPPATL